MTTHTPPRSTGLKSDSETPEEQLAAFVDGLSDTREPGVYVLRLSKPDADLSVLWSMEYDVMHPDIESMQSAERLFYVGAAKDVLGRIHEHLDAPNRSGALMSICPIHSVADVHWYDDVGRAFEKESKHAIDLRNERPDAYVSQH